MASKKPSWWEILQIIIGLAAIIVSLVVALTTNKVSIYITFVILVAVGASILITVIKKISIRALVLTWSIALVIILSVMLFLPTLLFPRIAVTGVIVDQSGAPVTGQMITINDSFSTPHVTSTDKDGKYAIDGVPKGIFTLKINNIEVSGKPLDNLGQEEVLNFTLPPSATPPEPAACPYQGKDDIETIKQLINAEATATNDKNMDAISVIFAPNAVIVDNAANPGPKIFKNPTERYQDDQFKNADFKGVVHFDILPAGQGIAGDAAWFTSGSLGFFKPTGGSDWTYFFNGSQIPPNATKTGSEHWIFQKLKGCWVISRMEFNSGHVAFPIP